MPTRKCRSETNCQKVPNKRTRHDDSTAALEKKIEKSEESTLELKAHAEKKTCPNTLRYNIQANIAPDADFKQDINRIRKEAEQKLISTLTPHRKIERTTTKLRKTEQKMKLAKAKKTDNEKLIKDRPHLARHSVEGT